MNASRHCRNGMIDSRQVSSVVQLKYVKCCKTLDGSNTVANEIGVWCLVAPPPLPTGDVLMLQQAVLAAASRLNAWCLGTDEAATL